MDNEIKKLLEEIGWQLSFLKSDIELERFGKEENMKTIEKIQDIVNKKLKEINENNG